MIKALSTFVLASVITMSASAGQDNMAQQCEQYGSYQNPEGEWITCEYEEPAYADEESEYQEEAYDEREDENNEEYREGSED